jgi:hypothetical protein
MLLTSFVARMVETEEIDFHALLDRPSALRYLSPEKLADFFGVAEQARSYL